ncbi:hypothetical protein GTA08_BOTSDO04678 [Neofusicoccum parvum]|nr:hypothetical protein GTA08_BOTSDO04678 [Neofusicoccum parvum]
MDHWPPFDMDPDFLEFANELSLDTLNSFYGKDENIEHPTALMDPNLGFKLLDHPVPIASNTNILASGPLNTPREPLFTVTTNNLFNYQHQSGPIGIDGPIPSFHDKRDGQYHCLMQPCPRPTFSRLADLQRHQNACHLGTAAFWCASTGCDRSQAHPYGRAFPRKDKRNDHEKKVHGRVLSVN